MIIYLGGSIHGLDWDSANGWREAVTETLEGHGQEVRNPLRNRVWHNPDEQRQFKPSELVHRDIRDISDADCLLVEYADPNSNYCGTSMELWEAHNQGKFIVCMVGEREAWSPWLDFVATVIVRSWEEAILYINTTLAFQEVLDEGGT